MAIPSIPFENESPETIRKKYLNHEAGVRSIGTLYYLAAVILIFAGLVTFVGLVSSSKQNPNVVMSVFVGIFMLMLGVGYFYVGRGFRTLNPKIKTIGTILACIGLLSIPIGTLINAYVLYLIHSQKGKIVFSEEYRQAIEATPTIKYKMSIIVVVLLAILIAGLLLVGVGIILSLFAKK